MFDIYIRFFRLKILYVFVAEELAHLFVQFKLRHLSTAFKRNGQLHMNKLKKECARALTHLASKVNLFVNFF